MKKYTNVDFKTIGKYYSVLTDFLVIHMLKFTACTCTILQWRDDNFTMIRLSLYTGRDFYDNKLIYCTVEHIDSKLFLYRKYANKGVVNSVKSKNRILNDGCW